MTVIIHDHHTNSSETYQGDKITIMRELEDRMPWLTEGFEFEDFDDMLEYIDSQQNLSVEVTDDREHPFVRG